MKINGKAIHDATRPQTIIITKDDVKKGATKDPGGCAAALACCRDLRASEARIHLTKTYVKIRNRWHRFRTPQSLQKEIVAFDRGGSFEPGEYVLQPILKSEMARRGRAHSLDAPKRGRPGKHRIRHVTTGVRRAAFK